MKIFFFFFFLFFHLLGTVAFFYSNSFFFKECQLIQNRANTSKWLPNGYQMVMITEQQAYLEMNLFFSSEIIPNMK